MLNLQLHIQPQTEQKLKKILTYTANWHNFTFLIPHPNPPPLGEGVYEKRRLCQFAVYTHDQEMFALNIIAYQITELQKGILNLRLDMKQFEEKYRITTEEFYQQFEQGILGDNEDFIVWSGIYEIFRENEQRLQELR